FRLRNQRREAPAIADPKNVNAARIDKIVVVQRVKRRTITGELRFEIVLRANSLAVADSIFVDPEQCEAGELRESTKYQTAFVFSVGRRFDRIAAQPASDKNNGEFSFRIARLRNDCSQTFAVLTGYRIVNNIDIRVTFPRRFNFS